MKLGLQLMVVITRSCWIRPLRWTSLLSGHLQAKADADLRKGGREVGAEVQAEERMSLSKGYREFGGMKLGLLPMCSLEDISAYVFRLYRYVCFP
jgi:hypothetical protein